MRVNPPRWRGAVAVLARRFGDIDVAEEAVQDAFAAALDRCLPRTTTSFTPSAPTCCINTTLATRLGILDSMHMQQVDAGLRLALSL